MADMVVINLADDDDDDTNNPLENEQNEEVWQHALIISEQMRDVSVSNYLPGMTQINLVMNQHEMVEEALTTAWDHDTPCERCGMNDPDSCFWIVMGFHLHMLGRQVHACNSVMHNTNICYYLYGQFVDVEYLYLHGHQSVQLCKSYINTVRFSYRTT